MNNILKNKIKEALQSILPLTLVVTIVLFVFKSKGIDVSTNEILTFLLGAFLLIVGLVVFSIGAEESMMFLSKKIGSYITEKGNLKFFILIGFLIGLLITIAEPSVWVLGEQFSKTVPLMTMVIAISLGSALFIVIALLRIIFQIPLKYVITGIFGTLFLLAMFMPDAFVPVAFDAGGFSTGPLAVPFLISLGFGVTSSSSNSSKEEDGFGMLGTTSIGPIFAVLVLGLFFKPEHGGGDDVIKTFGGYLTENMFKVGVAIVPFLIFFIIFQVKAFKFEKKIVYRVLIGFAFTYIGLVLFLTGASVGFMNVGTKLGGIIANFDKMWLLIPFGLLFGLVIVSAEPSVVVLVNQVQDATDGGISKKLMLGILSFSVSLAIGLAMTRIVYDISIWYFLLPGYAIVVILAFFVPKMFTAIAIDSGGAVSGALQSTFLVPFALGAAEVVFMGDATSILKNAFGLMAFVVMAPLITIQILGLIFKIRTAKTIDFIEAEEVIEFNEV